MRELYATGQYSLWWIAEKFGAKRGEHLHRVIYGFTYSDVPGALDPAEAHRHGRPGERKQFDRNKPKRAYHIDTASVRTEKKFPKETLDWAKANIGDPQANLILAMDDHLVSKHYGLHEGPIVKGMHHVSDLVASVVERATKSEPGEAPTSTRF